MRKFFDTIGKICFGIFAVCYSVYAWAVQFPYYVGKVIITGNV